MRLFVVISALLAVNVATGAAQTNSPNVASTAQQSAATVLPQKIDPAKEADIRRLLDLLGTKDLAMQAVQEMSKSIRPLLTSSLPPGEYREKLVELFFQRFTSKLDGQHFLDMAVPIYEKNFTHEEIRSLIAFYQTPVGRKVTTVLPSVISELREEGKKWGQTLGKDSMAEVLKENPDLLQALETAKKDQSSNQ